MIRKVLTLLALWLAIAATGLAHPVDSISDEVELRDGTVVKPQKAPRRVPKDDYVYTYKGVKYTYITEHNYTRYFNTSIHKPSDYGWYADKEGWFVNVNGNFCHSRYHYTSFQGKNSGHLNEWSAMLRLGVRL